MMLAHLGIALVDDVLNKIGAPINVGIFYDESGAQAPLYFNAGIWLKLKEGNKLKPIVADLVQKTEMDLKPNQSMTSIGML